jgi:pyruvate dehydrogenase E2 component (dihydrolipoamide acetyltransferase)
MKIFRLPDLGEGLPDAIIREWYVKEGEEIAKDQPMVAMETAKALVDVPAPYAGKVEKLFGKPDDTIDTGNPLIGFEGAEEIVKNLDAGTVVGSIETSSATLSEAAVGISSSNASHSASIQATPAVRMLAKQLGVDLKSIETDGGHITAEDVKRAAYALKTPETAVAGELTQLSGVRRAMSLSMQQSHREVVPATLVDDADITAWNNQNVTLRIIRAIQVACEKEPMLNCYYDGSKMAYKLNEKINIGIAVDTPHGLYVPVLSDVVNQSDENLRKDINRFKDQAKTRSIPQQDLQGATILMSNFGVIAGIYATPVIVPPMVSIIAIGKSKNAVVPVNNEVEIRRLLPLSLTFDHRAVTGGDAARFLHTLITELNRPVL